MGNVRLKKVDHFAYLVSNMDRAIDFYQNTLGLNFISREIDEEHGEEFSFFEVEGGNLELLKKINSPPSDINALSPEKRSNCPHIAFEVDDLEGALTEFKDAGVKIQGGPFEIENKVQWAYMCDPDDNIIELVNWLS